MRTPHQTGAYTRAKAAHHRSVDYLTTLGKVALPSAQSSVQRSEPDTSVVIDPRLLEAKTHLSAPEDST